ncbi:MAG: hypothetical protein AB4042_03210 [Leptolyngbyaceae cyanobacterium]
MGVQSWGLQSCMGLLSSIIDGAIAFSLSSANTPKGDRFLSRQNLRSDRNS